MLAVALAAYATNATLDSTAVATQYGFTVSAYGLGTATYNVGSAGAAFGVADGTTLTVLDLLRATDAQAVHGILYNGDKRLRDLANDGTQTIRIQIREDGASLDQIVLSPQRYVDNAPGPVTNDSTIVPK